MVFSLFPQITWAMGGEGTATNSYTISTLAELEEFRDSVNSGTTYSGQYIKLTANIDLGGEAAGNWTSIGKIDSNTVNVIRGTFDGGRYAVSGLYINSKEDYQGLFSSLGAGGTIKNLSVSGTVMGGSIIGGLMGMNNGTILNSNNTGTVSGMMNVGGVVGQNNGGTVSG